MSGIDPTLETGLQAPAIRVFLALQLALPAGNVNLLDSAGFVTFTANGTSTTFKGADPVYGTLASVGRIEDALTTTSPTCQIGILPPSPTAMGNLSDPALQGTPLFVWFGMVSDSTGLCVGTPLLIWTGRLDTVVTNESVNTRVTQLNTVSAQDRFFVAGEGQYLSDAFHQSVWPTETGLFNNVISTLPLFWGVATPVFNTPQLPIPGPQYPGNGTLGGASGGGSVGGGTSGRGATGGLV